MTRIRLFWFLVALLISPSLHAGVAEDDTGVSSVLAYRVALQLLYDQGAKPHLRDELAGILKFRWRKHEYDDEGAIIEVIPHGINQSKLRVTLPKDFGGRAETVLKDILDQCKEIDAGKWGKSVNGEWQDAYRAALRFVLKNYVEAGASKDEVIRLAEEDAGMIQFMFRENGFSDPHAEIYVVPVGPRESRVQVSLPADPGRRMLLEQKLLDSIKKDIENEKKDRF